MTGQLRIWIPDIIHRIHDPDNMFHFQGVQSVVTHSLQCILHSLGGIQVSHVHSSCKQPLKMPGRGGHVTVHRFE